MNRNRILWIGAALALLGGCQRNSGNEAAPANNGAAVNAVAANSAAGAANAVAPEAPPRTGLELRLAGGGLTAGQPGLHPSQVHEFGMPRAAAVAAIAAIRGAPTGEDANQECGAGPMQFTRFGNLTLNFQNGRWVGWDLSGPPASPPLRTEWDLGIGSARADLDDGDRDQAVVSQTSLGTEFSVGDIHGLLSGPAANATVTHMWAGTDCAFR